LFETVLLPVFLGTDERAFSSLEGAQILGRRQWGAGRGLPSLKSLALVERKNWRGLEESFFVMEALANDQEMDRYILKGLTI